MSFTYCEMHPHTPGYNLHTYTHTLTNMPRSLATCLLSSISHLLPKIIFSTSSLACWNKQENKCWGTDNSKNQYVLGSWILQKNGRSEQHKQHVDLVNKRFALDWERLKNNQQTCCLQSLFSSESFPGCISQVMLIYLLLSDTCSSWFHYLSISIIIKSTSSLSLHSVMTLSQFSWKHPQPSQKFHDSCLHIW